MTKHYAKKVLMFFLLKLQKITKKRVFFHTLKNHHSCCGYVPSCKKSYRRKQKPYFLHDFRKNPDLPQVFRFHFLKFFVCTPIIGYNWVRNFVTANVTAFFFCYILLSYVSYVKNSTYPLYARHKCHKQLNPLACGRMCVCR